MPGQPTVGRSSLVQCWMLLEALVVVAASAVWRAPEESWSDPALAHLRPQVPRQYCRLRQSLSSSSLSFSESSRPELVQVSDDTLDGEPGLCGVRFPKPTDAGLLSSEMGARACALFVASRDHLIRACAKEEGLLLETNHPVLPC